LHEAVDDGPQLGGTHRAAGDQRVEHSLGRQPLHRHQPIHDLTRAREHQSTVIPAERDGREIDVARQPPVER
jgi:hypothetical protein